MFLGHLKSENIDVNKEAAAILTRSNLKCNGMHNAIVDLFAEATDIKIVTTNYDKMFEQAIENKEMDSNVYDAPALPLGNDISGIVHIHGNVDNPKYMVLTDEDFGVAYLTEGYATRFLVRLFETYTVLFVGYSYKDAILRYLTRAMSRTQGGKKYILTDDMESNWNALGITPVVFPNKEFDKLENSIVKLGSLSKRGLLDWKNMFEECTTNPPRDLSRYTEIEYCFSNLEKVRVLTGCISGLEWIRFLDEKNIFLGIFDKDKELSEIDKCWMQWLIKETVGKEDDEFARLLILHGKRINSKLAKSIIRYLIRNEKSISNYSLRKYLVMLEPYVDNAWDITELINLAQPAGMIGNCLHLFKRFFETSFVVDSEFGTAEKTCVLKHRFLGDYYNINRSWNQCKRDFLYLYAQDLMLFMREIIVNIYEKYTSINDNSKDPEPFEIHLLNIESEEDSDKDNVFSLICDIFFDCCMTVESQSVELFRAIIIGCTKHNSVLLNKIGLKVLREASCINADEKFDIIMSMSKGCYFGIKEQYFLLVARIFDDISDDRRDNFIDYVENDSSGLDIISTNYRKYNWYVWLKSKCNKTDRVEMLESAILKSYDF